MRLLRFISLGFAVLAASLSAQAEEASPLRALVTGTDAQAWNAVGRLDTGGDRFCTATLISNELVLTAAHCVTDASDGALLNPLQMQFLAGLRNGRAQSYARIKHIFVHPKYDPNAEDNFDRIGYDLAVLELHQPIRKSWVVPISTDAIRKVEGTVSVLSYGLERSEQMSFEGGCEVLDRAEQVISLSCNVEAGSSGAPVLQLDENGTHRIVSVITAVAEHEGDRVAVGAVLAGGLAEVMRLRDGLAQKIDNATVFNPSGGFAARPETGGAKFVKP